MRSLLKITNSMIFIILFCSSAVADITIGVAGPLSGAYAAFGEQLLRGAEQAVADINADTGINGKQLKIVALDDACEPKQAVNVANKAIDHDNVDAIVGHFCSSSTIPASNIYADEGILMITPASTNPTVTERRLATIFRTCGRDDQQGYVAADFIVNQLNAQRVAVIHDKDTYGKGLADAMKNRMDKLGVKAVLYEGITRGEKDFNALVTKLKNKKVEVVYFGGLHTEAGPFVKQMREQGINAAFVSGDGIVSKDFIIAAGGAKYAKGVYMTFGADPREIPSGAQVVKRFREKNYEPEGYTLYAYATVEVIATAMQNTQTTDGNLLSQWLHTNSVDTIMGTKSWDDKGDLTQSDYIMYVWDDNGKYGPVL